MRTLKSAIAIRVFYQVSLYSRSSEDSKIDGITLRFGIQQVINESTPILH